MVVLVGLVRASLAALWRGVASGEPRDDEVGTRWTTAPETHLQEIQRLLLCVPPLLANPRLPPPLAAACCRWAATEAELRDVAAQLAGVARVALDLEHHSLHAYHGVTCLLQLSTGEVDYLVDAIALRQSMRCLAPVLSNPAICKVVHGGGSDVLWLQRDCGIQLVNVFDTEKACQVLGYQQRSLGSLLHRLCGVRKESALTPSDWRQRPLPREHIAYARTDVHWLLYIADCLGQELLEADWAGLAAQRHHLHRELERRRQDAGSSSPPAAARPRGEARCSVPQPPISKAPGSSLPLPAELDPDSPLGRCVHRSQSITLQLYAPPLPGAAATAAAAALMRGVVGARIERGGGGMHPLHDDEVRKLETLGDCVHALCRWRDEEARRLDEGVQCVLPDAVLLHLAHAAPASGDDLLGALHDAPVVPPPTAACRYPTALHAAAPRVAALLADAAAGQRPWVNADVQELMRPGRRKGKDPAATRQRLGARFGCKRAPYENCRMLAADGQLLCFCDRKRLEWYVGKGLAEEVLADPFTVRLTFRHRQDDQAASHAFYTSNRSNRCVACGEGAHYLRWRVVPQCYRRALPVKLKSHRSHDVLLLCVSCHEVAQAAAERLKKQVGDEYGIPLLPPPLPTPPVAGGVEAARKTGGGAADLALHARRAATALFRSAERIPVARRRELEAEVRAWVEQAEPAVAADAGREQRQEGGGGLCLTEGEVLAGLLAGLGAQSRHKALRRWAAEGRALPAALAAEAEGEGAGGPPPAPEAVAALGPGPGGGASSKGGAVGHAWHGQQVVAAAVARGGEAELAQLCASFRRCFVEALQPAHLPDGWEVDHFAPRAFGEQSVYSKRPDRPDLGPGCGGGGEAGPL